MWLCSCGNQCDDNHAFCARCGQKKMVTTDNNFRWYYVNGSNRIGPVVFDQVKSAITAGDITKETLVWHKGLPDWCFAANTSLQPLFSTIAPPISKAALSDKWLWSLATLPHFANLFLFQIINTLDSGLGDNFITCVVIGLNIIFLTLDVSYLKKAGHDIGKSLYLGMILVPVYMFVRSAKTNKNYWPAIVWCIIELLLWLPIW